MSAAKPKKKKKPKEPAAEPAATAPAPEAPATPAGPSRAHVWRGLALAGAGFGATFLLMAHHEQVPHGPGFGMLAMLAGTLGLLDALGLFTAGPAEGRVSLRATPLFALPGEPLVMAPIVTVPLALALFAGALIAYGGVPGIPVATLLALPLLLASALRRPALLVVVIGTGIILPFLGEYGLWDPWETHYGEVAREILARDDWISLWWAQEDWFMSKPILVFWIESLSMGALGVDFHSDANPAHPELAIRLPHFFLTMGALLAVYALVARTWSKRAGVIAASVLATMPYFFFLSHQAITDMPFVANMTIAMCALGLAVTTERDREVTRYALGPITLSARHLLIGAITLVVVPQILYLASRNVSFFSDWPPLFGWHGDVFLSGSAGNHGVPGNSPIHNVEPYLSGPGAQPVAQAIVWLVCFVGLLALVLRERRARSLWMFAFYFFCGLAFMAKGIPGFALPGLVALFFLVGTGRWELLKSGELRVGAGMLTVLTVGMPWYVAMFIRHGTAFTDRLLVHDHLNRLTSGVHGDNASIEYFVEQMGYGMFPWIALAPLALASFVARPPLEAGEETRARRDVTILAALWLAAAFTLFSAMTTKFHHYIFPAVPAAAILVGVVFDRMLRPYREPLELKRVAVTVLALLAPVPAVLGVAGRWGDVRGILPEGLAPEASADWVLAHPWPVVQTTLLIVAGIVLLAGALWIGREKDEAEPRAWDAWARGAVTTGLLAAPPVLAMVGRDLSWVTDARPQGYERLIHLFVYNYGRPWPTELDYRPILTGFAIVATVIVVVAAFPRLRDVALRAFLGVALMFSVWALDVYMIDLSPHWGQRELIQQYYELRASDEEPLVAWQMNWKGENFYTGNRAHVFVQLDNRALREWAGENRGRTAYFLLEHSRLASLRTTMRDSTVEEITDARRCNKFILVRVHLGVTAPPVRDDRE